MKVAVLHALYTYTFTPRKFRSALNNGRSFLNDRKLQAFASCVPLLPWCKGDAEIIKFVWGYGLMIDPWSVNYL